MARQRLSAAERQYAADLADAVRDRRLAASAVCACGHVVAWHTAAGCGHYRCACTKLHHAEQPLMRVD